MMLKSIFNNNFKEYFQYEDKLRRIVSKVSGILILFYSLLSGLLINIIALDLIFGFNKLFFFQYIILFFITPLTGLIFVKIELILVNLLISNTVVEKYTYLRLLLFVSIILYIMIMAFFYLFKILFILCR